MGELALRRIQSGIETTRGTAVAATRRVYGTLEPHRDQPRRYAVEDRGALDEKWRANARLVDASWRLQGDLTSEDLPYWLETTLKGGVAPTQLGTTGAYQWVYTPDTTTDTLKSRTLEWGDDSIVYRAPFAIGDQLEIASPIDDIARITLNGFAQEWVPQGNAMAGAWAGFTGGLTERNTEGMAGWQQRLFLDPASGTIGTTWVTGRLIQSTSSWKNQNKRKYFGDANAIYTGLGRGKRQTSMAVTFEALDMAQAADIFNTNQTYNPPVERALRIMFTGGAAGTTLGATSAITTAGAISTLAVTALAQAIPGGTALTVGNYTFVVAPAGAASSATAVPIISQTIAANIPSATALLPAKSITIDMWGFFDGNINWGNRETNVTFQLTLQAIYDITAAMSSRVTVVNNQSAALGLS